MEKTIKVDENTYKMINELVGEMRSEEKRPVSMNEALSKVYYTNAIDFFNNKGIKSSEEMDNIKFYEDAIQKYLSFL